MSEAMKEIMSTIRYAVGDSEKQIKELQSSLQQLQEENRVLREALKWCEDVSRGLCNDAFHKDSIRSQYAGIALHCNDALKSTPLTAKYQARIEAMEKVIKFSRKYIDTLDRLSIISAMEERAALVRSVQDLDALAALDAINSKEPKNED